jgi:branched-chain amino acid transport system substrate-binding protein
MLRHVMYLFLGVALLLSLSACEQQTDTESDALIVAVIAPFSGDFEPWGAAVRDGVVLAVDGWNQRGGVLGRPIQVTLHDSRCDFTVARNVTRAAIREGGAQFIIGAVCSAASEGVAQVTHELKVLQIAPTSVDPETTLDHDGSVRPLVFRIPFLDADQGTVAGRFAAETLQASTAAVLYAEGSVYGATLANAFEDAFTAADGDILIRKTYDQDMAEFYNVLVEVRAANPQVLYLPGYYDVMNRLVSQARLFGMFQTIIGSDGWDSPNLDLRAMEGHYFTTHYFPGESRPEVTAWQQLYTARYQVEPDAVATLSYDAANVLLSAVATAGTIDPYSVAAVLETATLATVSGQFTFNDLHNPIKGVPIVRVSDGRVIYIDRMMP